PAQSCEGVLFAQSVMLCSATKLAEIANAVTSVHLTDGVIVPPQASEDRHLVRKLVLETLGALAQVGQERFDPGSSSQTCAGILGGALANPDNFNGIFWRDYFFGQEDANLFVLPGLPRP